MSAPTTHGRSANGMPWFSAKERERELGTTLSVHPCGLRSSLVALDGDALGAPANRPLDVDLMVSGAIPPSASFRWTTYFPIWPPASSVNLSPPANPWIACRNDVKRVRKSPRPADSLGRRRAHAGFRSATSHRGVRVLRRLAGAGHGPLRPGSIRSGRGSRPPHPPTKRALNDSLRRYAVPQFRPA